MKKLNYIVNIIMGSLAGAFVGRSLVITWRFKIHPELYAMQSAPWYTSILTEGVCVLAVLLICIVIKVIIKKYCKGTD